MNSGTTLQFNISFFISMKPSCTIIEPVVYKLQHIEIIQDFSSALYTELFQFQFHWKRHSLDYSQMKLWELLLFLPELSQNKVLVFTCISIRSFSWAHVVMPRAEQKPAAAQTSIEQAASLQHASNKVHPFFFINI